MTRMCLALSFVCLIFADWGGLFCYGSPQSNPRSITLCESDVLMVDLISSAKSVISTNPGLVIPTSPGNWRPVLPAQHSGRAFPSRQALRAPFGEAAPPPHALILFTVLLSAQPCHRAHPNCSGNPAGLPVCFASAYWFHLTSAVRPHPAAYFSTSTHLSTYISAAFSVLHPFSPRYATSSSCVQIQTS